MNTEKAGKALVIFMVAAWLLCAYHSGADEFGRSNFWVLVLSTGHSLLLASMIVIPLLVFIAFLAVVAELYRWRWFLRCIPVLSSTIDSVPSYLWVLAAIASSPAPVLSGYLMITLVLFPLAFSTLLGVSREVIGQPFIQGAIISGMPRHKIISQHVLPHLIRPLASLAIYLFGSAMAVHGAIGAFGFTNRQSYDLGTLLLRGKELAALDSTILWLSLTAYFLIFMLLRMNLKSISTKKECVQ